MFGTNPGEVRKGPRAGLRVLAGEEDLGRKLVKSLTPEQRQHALNRLQRYADDCRALSQRPPAKAATEDRNLAVILALLFPGLDHA